MVGDRVRQVALPRSVGVGGVDPLDKVGGEAGIAAAVDEDAAVGQVGQQSSPVGDAGRGVQRDGLPDTVNLGCGDTVLGQHCGRQVGAFDLEPGLSCGAACPARGRA